MGTMSCADMLRRLHDITKDQLSNVPFEVTDDGPTEIVAAPGVGKRLIVLAGEAQGNAAGTAEWFNGSTSIGNNMGVGTAVTHTLGPWILDENTALNLTTVTATVRGWLLVATALV